MSTRFYLTQEASGISPTTDSGWTSAPSYRYFLSVHPHAPYSSRGTNNSGTGLRSLGGLQLASPPLQAQTLSGSVQGYVWVYSADGTDQYTSQMNVRVCSGDGTVIRGVALPLTTVTPDLSYAWPTGYTSRQFPMVGASTSLTSISMQQGDRILIELGARVTVTTTHNNAMYLGSSVLTGDLSAEGETTERNSWIEFSQDLLFVSDTYATRERAPLISAASRADAQFGVDQEIRHIYQKEVLRYGAYSPISSSSSGGAGVPIPAQEKIVYTMRAWHLSHNRFVFWSSVGSMDTSGTFSGYPPAQLAYISGIAREVDVS